MALNSYIHNHSTFIDFSKFNIVTQTVVSSIVTMLSFDPVIAFSPPSVQEPTWDHLLYSVVKFFSSVTCPQPFFVFIILTCLEIIISFSNNEITVGCQELTRSSST